MYRPAPLAAADLESVLRPFGDSTMLPAAAYLGEEVLAWERRQLFAGSWLCLGRAAEVTGTQVALTAGDIRLLLTVESGQTRAFANVCRHRGHELLPDGAAADHRAVVCPYHGWSYQLDGSLRTAPRMGTHFDLSPYGLVELPLVSWHGWLFVNATGRAMSFAEHLGTLDRLVAPYEPERLAVKARHEYTVDANWKVIAENYHECYHCPMIHPELCAVTPPSSGENWHEPGAWIGGTMRLRDHAETMSLDGRSHGVPLPGAGPREVRYLGLFPNLLLSLHPDYVMTHRLVPLTPGRTWIECSWLFDQAVTDPSYAVDFWDITNRQDWAACESVQRGVASPYYVPGPLAPNENAIYDWVTLLARAYRDPAAVLGARQANASGSIPSS
jgi:Rieske 2Fe-2S family protein